MGILRAKRAKSTKRTNEGGFTMGRSDKIRTNPPKGYLDQGSVAFRAYTGIYLRSP